MERSPFLPLPEGMVIGQVEITPTQLAHAQFVWCVKALNMVE